MDNPNQEILQQQPVQSEVPSQQSNNSNWLKTLSIGLGVVGIGLIIGIGGYVLGTKKNQPVSQNQQISISPTIFQPSPTLSPDPTANWKVYKSAKYGFSVKYPANLEADDQHNAPPSLLIQPPQTQPGAPGLPTFYISVMSDPPNPNDLVYNRFSQADLNDLYSAKIGDTVPIEAGKNLKPPYSDYWNFKRLPDIFLEEVPATVFENYKVWGGAGTDRRVLVKKNGLIYMLGTYYNDTATLDNFNLLITTFKFTK